VVRMVLVKRNANRFPSMIRLRPKEIEILRFQSGTSSSKTHGGRRYLPFAFTEHGVAMLSSVLTSKRAVKLNILIIRAFVRLREYLGTHKDLARKLEDVVRTQQAHGTSIQEIYGCIKRLFEPPKELQKRRIGFASPEEQESAGVVKSSTPPKKRSQPVI